MKHTLCLLFSTVLSVLATDPDMNHETAFKTYVEKLNTHYLVQRCSHDRHSLLYPRAKMVEHKDAMGLHPLERNHFSSFINACMGEGKTESPFSVSGLLTQVLNLGTIAEYLNVDLQFDPKTKRFIGNEEANARLAGPPPRAEWADCYKLA